MNNYWVYILSNRDGSVIYVGVSNDLERRLHEHKKKIADGFTAKYNVDRLEKQIKSWRREKKNALVAKLNPDWADLSLAWQNQDPSSRLRARSG